MQMNNRGQALPELLAPAGNPERLRAALRYGADAVYVGVKAMSLRSFAGNFTFEELAEGAQLAHALGRRVYVACNIFAGDDDIAALPALLGAVREAGADAIILSDPGVLRVARRAEPGLRLHLSTQANTLNAEAATFWHEQGIARIVLARELSIARMRALRAATPPTLELEAFVHGAMCVSYSGRCLLSSYLDGRDSNRGACVQPCRWGYALHERGKAGEYYPIEQDERGSYILNARDLCLIEHLPALIGAGLGSLKIEGRMKSVAYVATVVNAYRMALDGYAAAQARGEAYTLPPAVAHELALASHRPYTTGFALGMPPEGGQHTPSADYVSDARIAAVVLAYDAATRRAVVSQRNKFLDGQVLGILAPGDIARSFAVAGIWDEEGTPQESAPHPKAVLTIGCAEPVLPGDILRLWETGANA